MRKNEIRRGAAGVRFFDDKEFWAEVILRATNETGLEITLETWDEYSMEEKERFGKAGNRAGAAVRRERHAERARVALEELASLQDVE